MSDNRLCIALERQIKAEKTYRRYCSAHDQDKLNKAIDEVAEERDRIKYGGGNNPWRL